MCSDLFSTEVRAYDVLRSFQGRQIPKLYSTVSIPLKTDAPEEELLTIKGLLMEYVPGPTLNEMMDAVPREKWQSIVDQAINIVKGYWHLPILNKDVRPANIVISEAVFDRIAMADSGLCEFLDECRTDTDQDIAKINSNEYRVGMLDFALCEFRPPEQTDKAWWKAKAWEDEEGHIGRVMKCELRKFDFDLKWSIDDVDYIDHLWTADDLPLSTTAKLYTKADYTKAEEG